MGKFTKYAWGVLAYNILVIIYGAFVRATGSGAGCGAHWPLCNGEVIPRPDRIETIIEFAHRVTSGITLLLVIYLVVWAWRIFPRGSMQRFASGASLFFTITEALVGAGLVLFGWVAYDDSSERAVVMMIHLVNTFLLVGSIGLAALWSTLKPRHALRINSLSGLLLSIGIAGMLVLGASGAVTALGDTLYPATGTLAEEISKDFSSTSHYLIRLRVLHPGIAVSVGIYLALMTAWFRRKYGAENNKALDLVTSTLFGSYALQIVLGVINVALFAPVWLQMVHLLVTNVIWISLVLLAGLVLSGLATSIGDEKINDPVRHMPG